MKSGPHWSHKTNLYGKESYSFEMQQQEGQNNLYVWTVMEEGIEGKCENTYQVTEIPEYMVRKQYM